MARCPRRVAPPLASLPPGIAPAAAVGPVDPAPDRQTFGLRVRPRRMSLRTAVAAPFRAAGAQRVGERAFVVELAVDRDWFSPDQATRLVDVATSEGLLAREGGDLVAQFDPEAVAVPDDFVPEESLLQERTPFERLLDLLVDAGHDKQEAVAAINRLQGDLGVSVEAAAVVYARRQGVDVGSVAPAVREGLRDG